MADAVVLSYHDSLLKESDVSLLTGPRWLNDRVIGFYLEYLEYDVHHDFSDQVCFINPDVVQFIKLYKGSELAVFLDALNLHEKELVLLPVNDNTSASAGGTHWSLLVYSRKEGSFHHYDSSRPHNSQAARQCSNSLTPFLRGSVQPKFYEVGSCPQQHNSYDCGVYAMCFAETVCAARLKGGKEDVLVNAIGQERAQEWRTQTRALIQSLAKRTPQS